MLWNENSCGGCSSVGRVPDCDSGCRGFEPHHSPHHFPSVHRIKNALSISRRFFAFMVLMGYVAILNFDGRAELSEVIRGAQHFDAGDVVLSFCGHFGEFEAFVIAAVGAWFDVVVDIAQPPVVSGEGEL